MGIWGRFRFMRKPICLIGMAWILNWYVIRPMVPMGRSSLLLLYEVFVSSRFVCINWFSFLLKLHALDITHAACWPPRWHLATAWISSLSPSSGKETKLQKFFSNHTLLGVDHHSLYWVPWAYIFQLLYVSQWEGCCWAGRENWFLQLCGCSVVGGGEMLDRCNKQKINLLVLQHYRMKYLVCRKKFQQVRMKCQK